LIAGRVRQRAFVIICLRKIAHIEEPAARLALKNCSASLNGGGSPGLLGDDLACASSHR
jgi:hypothetical protein